MIESMTVLCREGLCYIAMAKKGMHVNKESGNTAVSMKDERDALGNTLILSEMGCRGMPLVADYASNAGGIPNVTY